MASSYSKAVLRSVVGDIEKEYDNVIYFPSFEIINSPASLGKYLATDLREVTEDGVEHVMGCFLNSFYDDIKKLQNSNKSLDDINNIEPEKIKFSPECEEIFNMLNK